MADRETKEDRSRLAKLRQRPEFLAIPALVFWSAVNVPNWPMYNGSIIVIVVRWGTTGIISGKTNSIFPITYALSVFSFVFFLLRFRKNLHLGWMRSFLLSATIPFGFVAFFETAYQEIFIVARPKLFDTPPSGQLLLASWFLVGLSTFPFWRLTRKFYLILAVDIVEFFIWIGIGYPQIYETGPLTVYALVLNGITKFTFALTYVIMIYGGTKEQLGSFLENPQLKSSSSVGVRKTRSKSQESKFVSSMRVRSYNES